MAIAQKVIEKKGDYLLAVKENPKGLYEATKKLFRRSSTREKNKLPQSEHTEKKENVHGRDESMLSGSLSRKRGEFFPERSLTGSSCAHQDPRVSG